MILALVLPWLAPSGPRAEPCGPDRGGLGALIALAEGGELARWDSDCDGVPDGEDDHFDGPVSVEIEQPWTDGVYSWTAAFTLTSVAEGEQHASPFVLREEVIGTVEHGELSSNLTHRLEEGKTSCLINEFVRDACNPTLNERRCYLWHACEMKVIEEEESGAEVLVL